MNLPPELTWLHLFPAEQRFAAVAPGDIPGALRQVADAPADASAILAYQAKQCDLLPRLGKCRAMAAINSRVSTAALQEAGFSYIRRFAIMPSLAKARWFIPLDNPSVASAGFSLYTPARASARVKRMLIRLAAHTRLPFWYHDHICIAQRSAPAVEQAIGALFPGRQLRLAISSGAPEPARNRKASLAVIEQSGEVLAFGKLAGSELSHRLVRQEAKAITTVNAALHCDSCAPKLLYANEVNNTFLALQTPLRGSVTPARWTPAHARFLEALRVGPVTCATEIPLVATLGSRLSALATAREELANCLRSTLAALRSTRLPVTIVHGDFAPWNLRERNGQLAAFDWEYARVDGVPLLDQTHFVLQVGYLLNDWPVDRAAEELSRMADERPLALESREVRAVQAVYLLDVILRLLEEGYDEHDPMIDWHCSLLNRVAAPVQEVAVV
jgi:hypothetical protein